MTDRTFTRRAFWQSLAANFVWMNFSEVARYFLVVRPMVRADFPEVPGIVPNTPVIAVLWTLWDILLILLTTLICGFAIERFGLGARVAVGAATLVWATAFVLLWLGLHNMGLATPRTMAAALPLAWAELVVAAFLVRWRIAATCDAEIRRQSA